MILNRSQTPNLFGTITNSQYYVYIFLNGLDIFVALLQQQRALLSQHFNPFEFPHTPTKKTVNSKHPDSVGPLNPKWWSDQILLYNSYNHY